MLIYETGGFTDVAIPTSARTMLELMAGAANPIDLTAFGVTFDAGTANNGILVELILLSATGTGTAMTIRPVDTRNTVSSAATAKYNDTVEPTVTNVIRQYRIPPTQGIVEWVPEGEQFACAASAGFGLRITGASGNVPKCNPWMRFRV